MNLLCAFIALECPKHRLPFAPPWVMSPKDWLKCSKRSRIAVRIMIRKISTLETRVGTMRFADDSTGAGEHGALQQTSPARATFLRSDGEWMEYESGSSIESRACLEEKQSFAEVPPPECVKIKHQVSPFHFERQPTARPTALHPYTPQLRVLSWNVNGIRAQLSKEEGRKALQQLVEKERPHVLGLQEIRIKAVTHSTPTLDGRVRASTDTQFVEVVQNLLPDYDTFWLSSFPPARQGYSGTALLVRRRRNSDIGCPRLLHVHGGTGHSEGDIEGRVTTVEYDAAFIVNVYTPNSGAGLKRLGFRTRDWDRAFATYVRGLEKAKPVVVIGDMNVAHEDKDFYNPSEKRMCKAAGTTSEERRSFALNLLGQEPPSSCLLTNEDSFEERCNGDTRGLALVDTFRKMHPNARGVFSYWSTRARNRPANRGMRLDYCLASRSLVNGHLGYLHDAFVLDGDTIGVSDHCPVGAVLRLGPHFTD